MQADKVLVTELGNPWSSTGGLGLEFEPSGGLTLQASRWLRSQTGDELVVTPESFVTSEPHYYVLGRKSAGGDARFSFSHARQQIQQVFGLIGGRADLDVYQTVAKQRTT